MTDSTGTLTLEKHYTPFGEVLATSGIGESVYGYTGEVSDESGLVYLRARYYEPVSGRFINRDIWEGDYYQSLTLNRWIYTNGNPINNTDPTGNWLNLFGINNCSSIPLPPYINRDWEYVGDFNLSGYYTPYETQTTWKGAPYPIEADHDMQGRGKYLSIDGGYTNDTSKIQYADREFLQRKDGVCMQGSGILPNAHNRVILCDEHDKKFEWDYSNKIANYRIGRTCARCNHSKLLNYYDYIYVDSNWFNEFLNGLSNNIGQLTVNDAGTASGLCNSNGHEGIDVYLGEGQAGYDLWWAYNQRDTDKESDLTGTYWPIYRYNYPY